MFCIIITVIYIKVVVCLFVFSAHFSFFSESEQCVVSFFFSIIFFCFTLLSSVSKAASRFYSTLLPGRFFVIVGGSFCTSLKRRQKCRLHEKKKGLILQPG